MAQARIYVCPLKQMEEQVSRVGARHLVSLINGEMMPETPVSLPAEQHLRLVMNDIGAPLEGRVAPSLDHVERLVGFIDDWDRRAPLVIHCWAGISRSTAAAFIALCRLNPERPEAEIAALIRRRSPTASPNALMVGNADRLLCRDGRMIDAVGRLGPARMASVGVPFSVDAQLPTLRPDRDGAFA